MNVTSITSAVILPFTVKSLPTLNDPVIEAEPDKLKLVFPSKPLFGDITNSADPDFILLMSPIDSAGMLKIPLPSPFRNDADTCP